MYMNLVAGSYIFLLINTIKLWRLPFYFYALQQKYLFVFRSNTKLNTYLRLHWYVRNNFEITIQIIKNLCTNMSHFRGREKNRI